VGSYSALLSVKKALTSISCEGLTIHQERRPG